MSELGVLERNKVWEENKQNKLKKQQEMKQDSGLEECTFAPKMFSKWNYRSNGGLTNAGSQKYVERMKQTRQKKEEDKKYE